MFTLSFCVLLVLSILALATAVRNLVGQPDLTRLTKFKMNLALYTHYFVIATMAVVLALRSSFSGRYAVLGYMVASFLVDHWYNYRLSEANRTGRPVPRRGWWPVVDNTVWMAAVLLLYIA